MIVVVIFLLVIIVFVVRSIIKFYKKQQFYTANEEEVSFSLEKSHDKKATAYIFLAAWLLKKNARYSESKVNFIRNYVKRNFDISTVDALSELTQALQKTTTIRAIARWVVQHLTSKQERLKLLDFLIDVSFSEQQIIDREIVAITRFGTLIGVSYSYITTTIEDRINHFRSDKKSVSNLFQHSLDHKSALKTLQINEDATMKEIKRAYRKLAAKYHPDKFQLETTQKQEEMTRLFITIQRAYNYLIN